MTTLSDTRDFISASIDQALLPEGLVSLNREGLGMAWVARRGLASLLQASQRWHLQPIDPVVRAAASTAGQVLPPLFGSMEAPEGSATELLTAAALIDEGTRMHHCVGDNWHDCLPDGTRIVRLTLPDGTCATAEFKLEPDALDPRFALGQLRGALNAHASAPMSTFASQVLEESNSPDRRVSRLQVVDAAMQAKRIEHERPAPRQFVRILDPRSRRELAVLLAWCARQADWRQSESRHVFTGFVAGFQYGQGPRVLDQIQPGDPVQLIREPGNPTDPLAVRVDWREAKLGYVPRANNRTIARLLDIGVTLMSRVVSVHPDDTPWDCVEVSVSTFTGSDGDVQSSSAR